LLVQSKRNTYLYIKMPTLIETIQSECLQADVSFAVILPEGDGPFPVIYDLHGLMRGEGLYDPSPTKRTFFETATSPFKRETVIGGQPFTSIDEWVNELGVAVVKVNGGAGWYLDSPRVEKSQYESHIIKELIPYVEAEFPLETKSREAGAIATATERSEVAIIGNSAGRGISGHSMGGFGAINFLCRYPELFSVGAIHCASLRFMPPDHHHGSYIEDLMSDEELRAAFPDDFLNALLRPDLKLRITVGQGDDPRIVGENRTLHTFLLENNQAHVYDETPGGHEYAPYGWEGVAWAAGKLRASRRDAE